MQIQTMMVLNSQAQLLYKKMITKKELVTAKVGVLAYKHKVSDRALTEILGASAVNRGVAIDKCTVSVPANRKRKETRSLLALCHPTASQNSFHPKLFSADSLQSLGQEGFKTMLSHCFLSFRMTCFLPCLMFMLKEGLSCQLIAAELFAL